MPDCPCLAELYLVQLLLCVRAEREGRGWKAAGRAPTDVWWYIKIRRLKPFSCLLSFDGNIQFTEKLAPELPVLTLVSWRGAQPLARASHTGPSFQTALFTIRAQTRWRTGHGSHIWFPISRFLSHIQKWQRHLCLHHTTLGQVPITLHGTHRVPLKDRDREQDTITVQMARSYSLSTCWGGLRKEDAREQRSSVFLAETSTTWNSRHL